MSEEKRDNKAMFGGPAPAGIQTISKEELVANMLGEAKSYLHDHDVPLPSRGIPYPVGHPLHGVESVSIRSMRSSDENILLNSALFKSGKTITELIRACMISPKCDPTDMLQGDRMAVAMAIRISGYGSTATSDVVCGNCGAKSKMTFNLNEFPIRYLDIPSVGDESNPNLFELELPIAKVPCRVRFMTGREEEEDYKKLSQGNRDFKATELLARMIVSINGDADRFKIMRAVEILPILDTKAIKAFIRDKEPILKMEQDWACPSCGHSEPKGLSVFDALFRTEND